MTSVWCNEAPVWERDTEMVWSIRLCLVLWCWVQLPASANEFLLLSACCLPVGSQENHWIYIATCPDWDTEAPVDCVLDFWFFLWIAWRVFFVRLCPAQCYCSSSHNLFCGVFRRHMSCIPLGLANYWPLEPLPLLELWAGLSWKPISHSFGSSSARLPWVIVRLWPTVWTPLQCY